MSIPEVKHFFGEKYRFKVDEDPKSLFLPTDGGFSGDSPFWGPLSQTARECLRKE
jgi:hypothetical protein